MLKMITGHMKLMFWPTLQLNWIAAAGLALSAVSAGMSFMGSNKQEKAAADAAEYQAALAKQQYKLQKEGIAASKEEAAHKASTDLHDTTIAFMKQRASVVAGAGESGVAGGSVTRTIVDKNRNEQDLRGRNLYALEIFNEQADRDLRAAAIGMAGQVNGYEGVSSAALAISSGLDFATNALSYWGNKSTTG